MANDSLSVRNGSRSDIASSSLDVGQLAAKNQSVKGASALDSLFGASPASSFSQVLDSQVKREPSVASRPVERSDASRSDKSGRNSGKDSPQQRLDAHQKDKHTADARSRKAAEREDAVADKAARDRAGMTDRRDKPERTETASRVNEHPTQSTRKNEPSKDADSAATGSNAPAVEPVTPSVVREEGAAPVAASADDAEILSESAVALPGQGKDPAGSALALAQQQLDMLGMPGSAMGEGGVGAATQEGNLRILQQAMLAAQGNPAGAEEVAMDGNPDSSAGASAGLALAGMEAVSGAAEVDPALKDLISAMMSARQGAASQSVGQAAAATVSGHEQGSVASLLSDSVAANTSAEGLAVTQSASAASEGPEASIKQMAAESVVAAVEEGVETSVTMTEDSEAAGDLPVEEALLTTAQETEENVESAGVDQLGAEASSAEDPAAEEVAQQARARQERPVPAMTTAATDKNVTANQEGWSLLDSMADALPKHLPKETPDALKNVTPQLPSDQQMAAVRDELRSLQRLVESGTQTSARSLRAAGVDDKGQEVKAASLSRSIENLTGMVKNVELRSIVPANNAPVAFGRAGFAEQMAEKIMLMTTQKVQSAEIRLDPKELGAVDVKIRIHQDQATVVFSSPHAQVRDALENSIPRLREMFAESGLGLGNVNVNDRGGSSAGGNEQSQGQGGNGGYGAGEEIVEERQQRLPRQPNGLVDFYA